MDVEQRFFEKVQRHPTACWKWLGHVQPHGYGQFWHDGQAKWAHRIAFLLCNGPLLNGHQIDHLCHNRSCVRPSHLQQITQPDNLKRRRQKGAYNGK